MRQSFHWSLDIYLPYNFTYHYQVGFPIVGGGGLGMGASPSYDFFETPPAPKLMPPMGHPLLKMKPPI